MRAQYADPAALENSHDASGDGSEVLEATESLVNAAQTALGAGDLLPDDCGFGHVAAKRTRLILGQDTLAGLKGHVRDQAARVVDVPNAEALVFGFSTARPELCGALATVIARPNFATVVLGLGGDQALEVAGLVKVLAAADALAHAAHDGISSLVELEHVTLLSTQAYRLPLDASALAVCFVAPVEVSGVLGVDIAVSARPQAEAHERVPRGAILSSTLLERRAQIVG